MLFGKSGKKNLMLIKKIRNEELWGWHDNSHTLIEEKKYWENGVLKSKTNYPYSYELKEKNVTIEKKKEFNVIN